MNSEIIIDNIPSCLCERPQWVCWRQEQRRGKPTKVPYDAKTGRKASSTSPATWTTFDEAYEVYSNGGYSGIGFVFTESDPFCGLDLDNCLDERGNLIGWAKDVVSEFKTYTEISPSGRGVKLFCRARKPGFARCGIKGLPPGKSGELEIYDHARYFTLTGKVLPGSRTEVADCQAKLDALCEGLWPQKAPQKKRENIADDNRTAHCLRAMLAMNLTDTNDGSHRLYSACCRAVEHNLTDAQAVACVQAYAAQKPFPGDWTDAEILRRVRDAEKQCRRGQAVQSPPELAALLNKLLGRHEKADAAHINTTTAPDPLPLDDPRPPSMPGDIFTGWLGLMVEKIAVATETPRELPALLCLATVATAVQGKFSIRPEPGYFEPLNIWTAPAMKSGQRKTAVHRLATRPLLDWEREKCRDLADQIKQAESLAKTITARLGKLRSMYAGQDDSAERQRLAEEITEVEASIPPVPVPPRLFTQDVTAEHLGTMMAEQDEKMAILSDEGGIFDVMAGRYSGGVPNLDIFLQSHSGSPVRVDRGSRPSVMLDHPLLTMGMSPQPDVLKSIHNKPGFRGRGLLARFLYALPESKMGYRDLRPRQIPLHITERYAEGIRTLLEIPKRHDRDKDESFPHVLTFDEAAYEVWKAHQRRVELDLREDGRFGEMTDWGGKLPGATARLAGLMHCAQFALDPAAPADCLISNDTTERAVRLSELLAEHALAVFDLMGDGGGMEAARKVWNHILSGGMDALTFSQIWHPLRGTFKTTDAIEPALEILLDHNLILPVEEKPAGRSGRRGRRFIVNPKVRKEQIN